MAIDDNIMGPVHDVRWRVDLEWKPQDMWIGAYWKRLGNCVDCWVCLIPCVPIHICVYWSREP